jgi:hypothetical protein
MGSKGKVMIRVGVAACVMSGLVGGYFGLRELLAPRDGSLLKRVGLAGVYLVEHDGQKFLVNSLGGMEKLDTGKDTAHESPTADARLSSATEPNALPTPPPTSYAAHVLDLYRQSIRISQQYSDDVALGEQERRDSAEINPQKRSSFVEDRPVVKPQTQKQESAPSPSPVAQVAPAAQGTPAADILKSIDKSSAPAAPSATPIAQPSPANAKDEPLHPPLKDAPQNSAKIQAAWAGFLAAQNVINPRDSAILVLRPPERSQPKAGPTPDTAPSGRTHVVDDTLDTVPGQDGTETYTLFNPSPTPSPDDLVPSASASPSPTPSQEHQPNSASHSKSHKKTVADASKKPDPDPDGEQKPSFWQRVFGKKESKPEEKPIEITKKTAKN